MIPTSVFAHLSGRVRLEGNQSALRFVLSDTDDNVNVIGANVKGVKDPTALETRLPYRFFDGAALHGIKSDRFMLQFAFVVLSPCGLWLYTRAAIFIVMPIDGLSFVSVQPSAVAAKCNENRDRRVRVVPDHERDNNRYCQKTLREPGRYRSRF
jgi:hypothetical protein